MTAERAQPSSKTEWRSVLRSRRSAASAATHEAEARVIVDVLATLPAVRHATVGCYVPFGPEPGSVTMLDTLLAAGARVLLPIVPEERGPLDWSAYDGPDSLATGPLPGLLEPSGARLGVDAISTADVVLVPAVGVDDNGARLGRGAGYYDRSLPKTRPGTELIAIVRDDELVPRLPAEDHDVRMTAALTPQQGLVSLPR